MPRYKVMLSLRSPYANIFFLTETIQRFPDNRFSLNLCKTVEIFVNFCWTVTKNGNEFGLNIIHQEF